jgi:hypothetical protein
MVPSVLLAALDMKVPTSAGRLKNTIVKSCMRTAKGFKCSLESISNKDSEKIRRITSLLFLVNGEVIEVDWYPLTNPVIKTDSAIMGDITGCQTLGVAINCHDNMKFAVNGCLEAIHKKSFKKILDICAFERAEANAEPFVFSHKGITTIAQHSDKVLTLKLSNVGIYKDPVRVHHSDILHLTYIDNETTIRGDQSITTQKIDVLWLNSTQREKLADKSHKLKYALDQLIPGNVRDYLTVTSLILSSLGIICTTICSYKITQWFQKPTESQDDNIVCTSRVKWYVPWETLQRYRMCSRIRRKMEQGLELDEEEYLAAIRTSCREGSKLNCKLHLCENIPLSAAPNHVRKSNEEEPTSTSRLLGFNKGDNIATAPTKNVRTLSSNNSNNNSNDSTRSACLRLPNQVQTGVDSLIRPEDKPKAGYKCPEAIKPQVYQFLMPHERTLFQLINRVVWLDDTFDRLIEAFYNIAVIVEFKKQDEEERKKEVEILRQNWARNYAVKEKLFKPQMPAVFSILLANSEGSIKPSSELDQLLLDVTLCLEKEGEQFNRSRLHSRGSLKALMTKLTAYKGLKPHKMSVYLETTEVLDTEVSVNRWLFSRHPSNSALRRDLHKIRTSRLVNNQEYLTRGVGSYQQSVEYIAPDFLKEEICENCLDHCENPIHFSYFSYRQLRRYNISCEAWRPIMGTLARKVYYAPSNYANRKCDRCDSSKCVNPLNKEDFSADELKSLIFVCPLVKNVPRKDKQYVKKNKAVDTTLNKFGHRGQAGKTYAKFQQNVRKRK